MSRLDQIQQMLAAEPSDVFLNFALAMELVKVDRSEEAITQFQRINQLNPDYIPAYFQQGTTLISMGRLHDASAILRQGIEVAERTGDQHAAGEMGELLATMG
jgi:predicted Zn-dependent protease